MSGGSSFKTHFLYTLYKSNQKKISDLQNEGGWSPPCLPPHYHLTTLNY